MTAQFHLFARVMSSVYLLGGIGSAAAAEGSDALDGSFRVAQAQPEQKTGKPGAEEEKAKEEKAKRKKRPGGAQEPPAAHSGQRQGDVHTPASRSPQAPASALEGQGQAKDKGEQRRRSVGERGAPPPQPDGLPPKAAPPRPLKPAAQTQPLRPHQPASQPVPEPPGRAARPSQRPSERKPVAAEQQPDSQPHGRAARPVARPPEAKPAAAEQQPDPQVMRQPLGRAARPIVRPSEPTPDPPVMPPSDGRAAPSVLTPVEPKQPAPLAQPAVQMKPPQGPHLLQQPAPGPPTAAPPVEQQATAQHEPASPDARRDWRERLKGARERRREERENAQQEVREARDKARQEVREQREQRRDQAQDQRAEHVERRLKRLEEVQQQRRERVEAGGQRIIIEEPDKRVIIRDRDHVVIHHDETERFRRTVRDLRTERHDDGTTVTAFRRPDGAEIVSVLDSDGRLLRRARRTRDGREIVFIDNSRHYHHDDSGHHGSGHHNHSGRRGAFLDVVVNLPPPMVMIPRHKYVVEYTNASEDDVYEALSAPPIERLDRAYSLEEVRRSYDLRERMRRVDLDAINFEFGSWEVAPDQYGKLERVAAALRSVLARNPDEVILIEGHTDAVGLDVDNLSLSDRRAESVAVILSETFEVPPENLTTQGYGEQHLKIPSPAPERANRRVAVRRITPLLGSPAG